MRRFRVVDTVPRSNWPPVNITHWSCQLMVGIGTLLAVVVVLFWVARRRGRDLLISRWFLRFSVISVPASPKFPWFVDGLGC